MKSRLSGSPIRGRWALPALLFVLALTLPSTAGAYIYWGSFQSNSIARADLDGSHRKQEFVKGINSPSALDVTRSYIYWADFGTGAIGRANLDGTHIRRELIVGAQNPEGIAVYGNYIYWANFGLNSIGRANLDGSHVNQFFIATSSPTGGVAVRPPYVYWTDFRGNTIGRAGLDGSNPNQTFITGASSPDGLAISGNQIYWANYHSGTIGRANLNGSDPTQRLIAGGFGPSDLAIQGSRIYWSNQKFNSVGRADLNGSGTNQRFLRTARFDVESVAADGGVSSPSLTNVKQSAGRWREGNALPRFASADPPVGTTFSFGLDRSAQVKYVFFKGSRMVAMLTHGGRSGRSTLRFQGRVNARKRLGPGAYTLKITATAAGRRSRTAMLRFTILRK
jgi:hypothetical protein